MAGSFLTAYEREKLDLFPDEISLDDVITYFTMTDLDLAQIPEKSAGI